MRILVVEDDKKIASFVAKGLKEAGYAVDVAQDGLDGLDLGLSGVYDAAVVDIMLPGLDGLTLIERLRAKKNNTPVIILSAKRTVDDRVKGLQAGGDDYLTKPFSFSELLARIQALIRRDTRVAEPSTLTVGDLYHRSIGARSQTRGRGHQPAGAGIRAAGIPDETSQSYHFQDIHSGKYLRLQLRSADKRCRCPGVPPAQQDRQRF